MSQSDSKPTVIATASAILAFVRRGRLQSRGCERSPSFRGRMPGGSAALPQNSKRCLPPCSATFFPFHTNVPVSFSGSVTSAIKSSPLRS
jgi:hypothetical protein